MKIRIYRFGQIILSAVQNTPKNTVAHSAGRSVFRIRILLPAPKLAETFGSDVCPTLYAQHCT